MALSVPTHIVYFHEIKAIMYKKNKNSIYIMYKVTLLLMKIISHSQQDYNDLEVYDYGQIFLVLVH